MSGDDQIERRVMLQALDLMATKLRPLQRLLNMAAEHLDVGSAPTPSRMMAVLAEEGPGGALRSRTHTILAKSDYVHEGEWTGSTPQNTLARRDLIYSLLELNKEQRSLLSRLFPPFPCLEPIVVIEESSRPVRWYVGQRRVERNWYWPRYEGYLLNTKRWDAKNVALVDQGSTDVVERLADPEVARAACKGLVVGYVQSGKTSNFTAVIAKAADAGYRLFIVLAGTQNTLRDQTQRRLDKELIGKEYVGQEYSGDPDWQEFVSEGGPASLHGGYDWERLTTAHEDFQSLGAGIAALKFARTDLSKPFRHPSNLHRSPARVIVIKKNATALKKLIEALKRASTLVEWREVPSLVIDDESDQASLNTKRPTKGERKTRTAINRLIVELLGTLGGAQYVGYTATPFANVFVDPSDAEDLFPSDFILSLPRPIGYMGASDFIDEGSELLEGESNRRAFVRDIRGDDEQPENLPMAIDSFVLGGMVKLWRENAMADTTFEHHTMLVHNSPRVNVHREDADRVQDLFLAANYAGGGPGVERLRRLWESDFAKVCATRAEDGVKAPSDFEALLSVLGKVVLKISGDGGPTIILNGAAKDEPPDFDRTPVWKIICGGAKLSRGYTVEGLTVSYYRRRAGAADTLMQMGRWFGYRHGYRDLVRLFIGREEPLNKSASKTIDLYEAFRGVCNDEQEFRDELKRYSALEPGQRITPKQVPPLVPSNYLRPAAANKMYNAKLTYVNYGGRHIQRTVLAQELSVRKENLRSLEDLLGEGQGTTARIEVLDKTLEVAIKEASERALNAFFDHFKWGSVPRDDWALIREYLDGAQGDPGIASWVILLPAMTRPFRWWTSGDGVRIPIRQRSRNVDETRFEILSEPPHIEVAKCLAGLSNQVRQGLEGCAEKGNAVIIPYLVVPKTRNLALDWAQFPALGFSLVLPENNLPTRVGWSVRDPTQPDAVVVSAPSLA